MNSQIDQSVLPKQFAFRSRLVRALLIVLALCAAATSAISLIGNAKIVYNDTRAAPTLAIFHGVRIFEIGLKDVSFCVLYGPLSYLFYLPAAIFREPKSFFLAGCVISLLLFCAPLLMLLWRLRQQFWTGTLLAVVFSLATFHSLSLTTSALSISPDAVALGLGGAACTLLFLCSGKWPWLEPALIAACTCSAVFSKQNMVALLFILPLFSLLIAGPWAALRLVVCLGAGALLSIAILFAVYHDLSAVYFNTVVVVRQQPLRWDRAMRAARLLSEQGVFLLFAIGGLFFVSSTGAGSLGRCLSRIQLFRVLIFASMAVILIPFSIGGMIFWGGWMNALSPALYFSLLTLLALSYLLLVESRLNWTVHYQALGILLMFSTFLTPLIAEELDRSALRTVSSSEIVYRYDLQHPGQIYFPFHQVSVYFAEHKFYHSDWGVMDLIAGRFPVSKTEVWSHIPPAARFIAYPPDVRTDIQTPYLAPSHRRVDLPGLPGFAVFELER